MVNESLLTLFGDLKSRHGSHFAEPKSFSWVRNQYVEIVELGGESVSGDPGLARAQIVPRSGLDSETYSPLESEPDLYLEFAAIGRKSWIAREQNADDVVTKETNWAISLTERFGVLSKAVVGAGTVLNAVKTRTTEPAYPSVWDIVGLARAVDVTLLGHKFCVEGTVEIGKTYSNRRSKGFDLQAALIESILSRQLSEVSEFAREFRKLGVFREFGDRTTDDYRSFVSADIASLVTNELSDAGVQSTIVSSLNFGKVRGNRADIEPKWTGKHSLDSLNAAIWVQVATHLLSGSQWRDCQNLSCKLGVFRVESQKSRRRYCDDKCKESQNNRDKYKKCSQKNVESNHD